jgi:hypothetical protein
VMTPPSYGSRVVMGGGGEAVNIKGGIDKCEVEPGEEEEQRPGRRSRGGLGDGSCVRPVAR